MKPSERFKKRYVSFKLLLGGAAPSPAEAKSIVHEHFLAFFGEMGISSLAFKLIKYGQKDGTGIVRCARGSVEETIFCMACASGWNGKSLRMEPLSTSGTIKRV